MSLEEELRQLRIQVSNLTARVYQLELRSGVPDASKPVDTVAPPVAPQARPLTSQDAPHPAIEMPRPVASSRPPIANMPAQEVRRLPANNISLERRIGSQWLNRVGIVAVLVGVSYFLKLAADNGWVGPGLRVLFGLIAGIAIVWWSERFRRSQSITFSYSLKAVGIGILYLSLWASFQLYQLIPASVAFVGMVLVTAATAVMAIKQHSELLAGLVLLGGYLTPVLLSTGQNNEAVLLTYLSLLAAGSVVVQRFEHWPRIALGAWVGSLVLYLAWADHYYSAPAFVETVFFISILFAVFASAPFLATYSNQSKDSRTQIFAILAVVNAFAYFFELYALHDRSAVSSRAALDAICLSALYFGLGMALLRREQEAPADDNVMWQVHQGLAIAFLTMAIALRLDGSWITFGWLVESAALYVVGARSQKIELKVFGVIVLTLALVRLVFVDTWHLQNEPLIFNQRFGLYLLAIAALATIVWFERSEPIVEGNWVALAVIAINLLAIAALCLEVNDYYRAQRVTMSVALSPAAQRSYAVALRALRIEEGFVYSAVLMAYGVVLMIVGFWKQAAFLRWQAILLIGVTIAKVFLFDMSNLDRVYRIASFIILGVILLGISYAYQKDWLGLQRSH